MKEIFHWNDRELLRYLGCKNGTVPDQNLTDLIAQCKQELEQAASPRVIWREYPLCIQDHSIDMTCLQTQSKSLERNLKDCERVLLFAATLGSRVDVLLHRYNIADLYAAGCRNIQLDDCTWGCFVDPKARIFFGTDDAGLEKLQKEFLKINNLVIEGQPENLVINTHICRGNFHSTWACTGAYDKIAELVFGKENVNALYLEFDDARSGGFECLKHASEDKKVVLGLITTKSPKLEDKNAVIARIHEAAKYVPLDRLYLSPQCGFASCEIGNKLTVEEQWAKLKLVKEIAEEVWG